MYSVLELKKMFSKKDENFLLGLFPITKLTILACIWLFAIFTPTNWFGYGVFLVTCLAMAFAGRFKPFWKIMRVVIILFVILVIAARTLFYGDGTVFYTLGRIKLYTDGFNEGFQMSALVLAFSSALLFFLLTTDAENIMIALEQKGCSRDVSYIVLSTMQLVAQFKKRASTIQDSQRSRGIETEGKIISRTKAFIPMLGPLVLSAICSAEERTLALETRGYSYSNERVRVRIVEDTKGEQTFRKALITVTVFACIGGAILKWIV